MLKHEIGWQKEKDKKDKKRENWALQKHFIFFSHTRIPCPFNTKKKEQTKTKQNHSCFLIFSKEKESKSMQQSFLFLKKKGVGGRK